MEPTLLFDKSFLQSLSVDEATILDQLYICLVTPVFFVETLADLAKPENERRSPDKVVGGLAERTPVCRSFLSASHWEIAAQSFEGLLPELDGRPVMPRGIPVRVAGKRGVVYRKAPETEAFERWQRGLFVDVERTAAARWRKELSAVDLAETARAFRAQLKKEELPKSLEAALDLAKRLLAAGGLNFRSLQLAFSLLGVPSHAARHFVERWKRDGRRTLQEFAPFVEHCVLVDLFFYLAMSNGLISDQRPSNLVDMAYLYYLPFTRVFVSSDKLHQRVAPLLMTEGQTFAWGPALKEDLARADAHFASMSDEERAKGLFLLAKSPPAEAELICAHWDSVEPGWREVAEVAPPEPNSSANKEIIETSNAFIAAAEAGEAAFDFVEEPDHLIIQRFIPKTRGKWRMFSAEVEAAEDRNRSPKE